MMPSFIHVIVMMNHMMVIDAALDVSSKDRLLVHGYFGQSRAPTIVIAWLLHRRRYTVGQAMTLLADKHKKCQPV